jgi:hypothetical protein
LSVRFSADTSSLSYRGIRSPLPAFSSGPAVVVGVFTPSIVPLVLGRVHELLRHRPAAQKGAWSKTTTSFAIAQTFAAYGMSFLSSGRGRDYLLLFALGSCARVLALVVDLVVGAIGGRS